MAALTTYTENKLIDHIFRGVAYTPPANIYVALFTVTPTATAAGTEVSGGAYARVQVPASPTSWQDTAGGTAPTSSGTGGATRNVAAVQFPTATASWGTVVAIGYFDAATGGNLLGFGPVNTATVVASGVAPYFGPGLAFFALS